MENKYTEAQAVRSLSARGCKISGGTIDVPSDGLGIKILGKLDYLTNCLGYRARFLPKKVNAVLSNGGN